MGLDYSYLLYFHRKDLWTVVNGLTDYTGPSTNTTRIVFPDKVLEFPLEAMLRKDHIYQYDTEEISLVLSMRFPVDDAIEDWLLRLGNNPPSEPKFPSDTRYAYVGCIYLFIHQGLPRGLSRKTDSDTVLFDFGTTGTRMSMLFYESGEIRNTFTDLLSNYDGICGVFNREDSGEVFWCEGRNVSIEIDDPFMPLEEIRRLVQSA